MDQAEMQSEHRSGYVGLIGRPNVGKSTLINVYLGQSIAPTSPWPQTTRRRQLGILTLERAQLIFVDTPGLHKPHHRLGEWMNTEAQRAMVVVDTLLVIFDISQPPHEDDHEVTRAISNIRPAQALLAGLNKVDLLEQEQIEERRLQYQALLPAAEMLPFSATRGDHRQELLKRLIDTLPFGPRYYSEETITESTEREIAVDLIRTAGLHLLRDEVPHSIDVRMDAYQERGDHGSYIAATIFVERQSQKGIVIGKGGAMLRDIGRMARIEIERMSGRKVYLELRVKVLPKWRNDQAALNRLGYRFKR
jgi:GTP-binding protein Era